MHHTGHNARVFFNYAACYERTERSFEGADDSLACFGLLFMVLQQLSVLLGKRSIVLAPNSEERNAFKSFVKTSSKVCKKYQHSLHPPKQLRSKVRVVF
jgi:hypothetical protein